MPACCLLPVGAALTLVGQLIRSFHIPQPRDKLYLCLESDNWGWRGWAPAMGGVGSPGPTKVQDAGTGVSGAGGRLGVVVR